MRVVLKKLLNNKSYDITQFLSSFIWSGSIENGVRSFSFNVLNANYDLDLMGLIPIIATGDIISLFTDNDYVIPNYLCFYGKVYSIERKSDKGTISFTCLDFMNNLSRSSTYKAYKNTAEEIAKSICNEYGLTIQHIEPTGINIGNMVFEDETYFDIISKSYKKASLSTGLNYYIMMDGDKFCTQVEGYPMLPIMISDGTDGLNAGKGNILHSNFSESMSDLVNRVNVYDSDGNFINRIEDSESISKYGLFETNYTIEKDVDMNVGAKKKLHGIDIIITFDVLGDPNYWSGRSVMVHDTATNLDGQFLITNDTHTWDSNSYITKLNLKYLGLVGNG